MKSSTFYSTITTWMLTLICFIISSAFIPRASLSRFAMQTEELKTSDTVSVLTRYQVKNEYRDQFRKALRGYVNNSVTNEQNIMAEAFSESENPLVLWLIERWSSKTELNKSRGQSFFKAIETLSLKALEQPIKSIPIRDLEPISKKEWRKEAGHGDDPIVIMLFVDSKPGTEETFKSVYHTAMPQFRSEPGVINYQLSQLEDDKTQFVTYEKFRNEDAFQYHLNFPPIKPVLDYLNTSIKQQPFQNGLHRLVMIP